MCLSVRRALGMSILAAAVGASLVLAGCERADTSVTSADSKSPPTASINGGQEATQKQDEESSKDAGQARAKIDLTVPEGDAAELTTFLRKLDEVRLEEDTPDAIAEFKDVQKAILRGADKLLAKEAQEEDARLETVAMKWNASIILVNLDDEGAEERFMTLANELAKDKNPLLAKTARVQLRQLEIMNGVRALMQGTSKSTDKLVEDINLVLGEEGLRFPQFELVQNAARVLESLGKYEEARQIYARAGTAFASATDPQLAAGVAQVVEKAATRLAWIGKDAEITGTKLNGEAFDLAEHKGKVVLVDFWATWCGPCIVELPNVIENYKKYHDRGFDVVGISLDDNKDQLDEFLARREIPWTTLWSPEIAAKIADDPFEHPLAIKYGVDGIPATFLVDQEGKVIALGVRGKQLGEKLAELLGEPDEVVQEVQAVE